MRVDDARAAARTWVAAHAASDPAFRGAFLTGSTLARPASALLPATSDVDLTVLVGGERRAPLPASGKRRAGEVLLDVSYLDAATLADPAWVARSFVYAPSFRGGHVLADPTGHLTRLEAVIGPRFATPAAVRARVEDVHRRIRARLGGLDPAAPWAALVLSWLFPTSLTAVAALVAAGEAPTVRLRYLRAREVLSPGEYTRLLAVLGCADTPVDVVARHVAATAERFDEAAAVLAATAADRPSFPFAADITAAARPVAVDGSRELVEGGHHREAVFWVVATAARSQEVLDACAPALARRHEDTFRELVADLTGLRSPADARTRAAAVLDSLPASRPEGEREG